MTIRQNHLSRIQMLNLTLALALNGCVTAAPTLPVFSNCPPPHVDPIDYDVRWPEIFFRYPVDKVIKLEELLYEDWHIIVGYPEILNWSYCQTFFENQGLEVHYTNNIIYMRQRL
jgi:hypothetical protein